MLKNSPKMNSADCCKSFSFSICNISYIFKNHSQSNTETWSSARSILESLFFNIYIHINYLCLRINAVSKPILFADDTSTIISSRNFKEFSTVSNLVLSHMIKWLADNNLAINSDKKNIMNFITRNSSQSTKHTGYKEK
jgi:hypothetical protein